MVCAEKISPSPRPHIRPYASKRLIGIYDYESDLNSYYLIVRCYQGTSNYLQYQIVTIRNSRSNFDSP